MLLMRMAGYALAIMGLVVALVSTFAVLTQTPHELLSFWQFAPGWGLGLFIVLLGLYIAEKGRNRY